VLWVRGKVSTTKRAQENQENAPRGTGVAVRDEGKVGTVRDLAEDGHEGDETHLDADVGFEAGVVLGQGVKTEGERHHSLKETEDDGRPLLGANAVASLCTCGEGERDKDSQLAIQVGREKRRRT
jgi:hypothetical protein